MVTVDVAYAPPSDDPQGDGPYQRAVGRLQAFVKKFIMTSPGTFFFGGWLMLVYSLVFLSVGLVYVYLAMVFLGFLFIYLPLNYWVHGTESRRPSIISQVSLDLISRRPQLVVVADNPPRYESLPDLHPELFKVTLPPYDEVCNQLGTSAQDRSEETIVPIHGS